MKIISIWQPFASLAVEGFKFFETRGWPAPKSLIGETIGIASTKTVTAAQRDVMACDTFRGFYENTLMRGLHELPHGFLLGTAVIDSCELIDEELMENVTREEIAFGWWEPGRYAWRLRYPKAFAQPIPIQGRQGIWSWDGDRVPVPMPAAHEIEANSNVVLFPAA